MKKDDLPPLAPPDKQPPHVVIPEAPKKTVGWAIVGLGQLAIEEIMPAFGLCRLSKPVALVSGHPDKAKKIAEVYGVNSKAIYEYESYDQLQDNDDVDVVYIVLPNSMHAEFTIRALQARKHVLCEKPMATTTKECQEMIEAANACNRKLMIAYRLRYEPFHQTAIEVCRKGELGDVKSIVASNGQDTKAPNIRLSKSLGGGPLQDVGIYCINAFRYLTNEEPTEVMGIARKNSNDPRFREVHESVAFMMKFPSGVIANGDCSFGITESRDLRVQGSEGTLNMDAAFAYHGQRLFQKTSRGNLERKLEPVNHFAAEMDYFSECILENREPRTPGADGLADIKIITAIEKSIELGKMVAVGQTRGD